MKEVLRLLSASPAEGTMDELLQSFLGRLQPFLASNCADGTIIPHA
jgi:hypothetical protein